MLTASVFIRPALDCSNPAGGGSSYDGENGTEASPFLVADAADLAKVGSGTDGWTLGKHYKMTSDIDISATANWTPIGSNAASFTGTFDGGGYKITGLNITGRDTYRGLFGYIGSGASVRNAGVSGTIAGSSYVGGIAGRNSGTIENCYFTGIITAVGDYIGGVTGYNGTGGTIQNSYNTGTVFGAKYTGGIVGCNTAKVENCYNTGTVSSYTPSAIGGITGYNSGSVENSVSLGAEVKNSSSANNYSGRVAGVNSGILSNNYAYNDMAENNNVTAAENMASSKNGADISIVQWGSFVWWTVTAEWDDAVWDFSSIGASSYPQLRVFL